MNKPEFVPPHECHSNLQEVADRVKAIEAHLAAQSQPAEDRQPIMLEIAEADENHKKWERRWKALMRMYPPESPCFADRNGEWCLRYFLDYVGAACGFVGQEHPIAQPADRQLDPQAAEPVDVQDRVSIAREVPDERVPVCNHCGHDLKPVINRHNMVMVYREGPRHAE